MRILIDMDEVLVQMLEPSVYYYNKEFGTDFNWREINQWELPGEHRRWQKIWRIPGFFASMLPVEWAVGGVRTLVEQGHQILVASSPVTWEAYNGKSQWFHMHFVVPGILRMKNLMLGRDKTWLRGDIIVDDGIHNLEHPEAVGICFDRPWNQEWDGLRAYTWDQVVNLIGPVRTLDGSFEPQRYVADGRLYGD